MAKQAATIPLAVIRLDHASSVPLYVQLYERIRHAIVTGQLAGGVRLPSTRDLATDLGISRNTVTTAFDHLFAEGYIEGKVGAGTYVAQLAVEPSSTTLKQTIQPSLHPAQVPCHLSQQGMKMLEMRDIILRYKSEQPRAFRPGLPALDAFPSEIWSKLIAQRWRSPHTDLLSYGDPHGYRPLRECIAEHLRMTRAMRCEADQVIIVSGSQQALDIATRVLLDPGDAAWIEDPGYLGARGVLLSARAQLVPVPVDQEGLNVKAGMARNANAKLAYVTPSHQFPLGIAMSLARRYSLLQWAATSGAWILEDDYDSEYRYVGHPLPALQGMDENDRVIYMGTFSKVLFPSLRLGYLVVPTKLIDVFVAARAAIDRHSPLLEQAVLADFMTEGHFTRHIRRMRVLYAERQAALLDATHHLKELIKIYPSETGMHVVGWLPKGTDDRLVAQQLAQQGLTTPPLSLYQLEPSQNVGLVIGYTAVTPSEIKDAVHQLETVLRRVIASNANWNMQYAS
jgi:GntR family transcriptional regulator / MocR family aminotransferase